MNTAIPDNRFAEFIARFGERIRKHEPLARYTTFKIGGPADYFYEATTREEFIDILTAAHTFGISFQILGGGTNVLIGDLGMRGLVIRNTSQQIAIRGQKGMIEHGQSTGVVYVEADSGVSMNKLVRFTLEEGLSGLEMHLGLPGTVGGAVYMNSKWTKPVGYVGDPVHQVTLLTRVGDLVTVPRSYFRFAYDYSQIQQTRDTVISVTFALKKDERDRVWQIANESIAHRRATQPQGVSTAGCIFKNISRAQALAASTPNLTTSAGFLIDHAGLKGKSVGDAQISPVHANFIVNTGHARASDVVELIEKARSEVLKTYHISLEEEVVRVGEF